MFLFVPCKALSVNIVYQMCDVYLIIRRELFLNSSSVKVGITL